jgi:hypothetical protein
MPSDAQTPLRVVNYVVEGDPHHVRRIKSNAGTFAELRRDLSRLDGALPADFCMYVRVVERDGDAGAAVADGAVAAAAGNAGVVWVPELCYENGVLPMVVDDDDALYINVKAVPPRRPRFTVNTLWGTTKAIY